jgi:hypothetical protein
MLWLSVRTGLTKPLGVWLRGPKGEEESCITDTTISSSCDSDDKGAPRRRIVSRQYLDTKYLRTGGLIFAMILILILITDTRYGTNKHRTIDLVKLVACRSAVI